jgi:hypothetical protein
MIAWDETKRRRARTDMSGNGDGSKTTWVDPDDAPELADEWFQGADFYEGGRLVRRSRPVGEKVILQIDPEVLAYFRAGGPGWQSRVNQASRRAAGLPTEEPGKAP